MGFSLKINTAPIKVKKGPADRIGAAVVIGKCFRALYPKSQEHEIITALTKIKKCCHKVISVTKNSELVSTKLIFDTKIKGALQIKLQELDRHSTGRTALFWTLCFLQIL